MKRKIVSTLTVLVILVLLSGCSINIDISDKQPSSVNIEQQQSGLIFERVINSQGTEVPVGFTIWFDKQDGELTITVKDPNKKEIYSGQLRTEFVYPNRPEDDLPTPDEMKALEKINSLSDEQRNSWGYMTFAYIPEVEGNYTLEIHGQSATGSLMFAELDSSFKDFSGKVEYLELEIENIGDPISFIFLAGNKPSPTGKLFARIFDPTGKQIRVFELIDGGNKFVFEEPAEMTGKYTAYIDAENSSALVRAQSLEKEEVPNIAFLLPILITLLGIIGYFFVKRGNRKLVIWGAIFWLGAYFVGSILSNSLSFISNFFWGNYGGLNYMMIIGFISSLLIGISPLLTGVVADIKKSTPKELLGFAAGFVIAPSILEGLNGIMNVNSYGSQILPYGSKIPGTFESASSTFLGIGIPLISRIGLMVIVFAFTLLIVWALRQKTERINKGMVITGSVLGIAITNLLFTYVNTLATQTQAISLMSLSYPFGTPLIQGVFIALILSIVALYIYNKRSNLISLAEKACSVTIEDMRK